MSMPRCRSIWAAVTKQRLTSSRKAAPKQIRESVCRESPPRLSEAASFTADAERTIQGLGFRLCPPEPASPDPIFLDPAAGACT